MHWSGRLQTPPFRQGLAQMAAGAGRAVWNWAAADSPDPRVRQPRGPGRASLTFITGERPGMPLLPALAAHGVGLPHLLPNLPPRHAVSGPGTQHGPRLWTLAYGSWFGFLGFLLKDPEIQATHPSPVGAADAPSSTHGQVGLIYRLAVGLVVTERDHQRLLRADPLTAPMREKVGDIEWARPWGAWSPRCL